MLFSYRYSHLTSQPCSAAQSKPTSSPRQHFYLLCHPSWAFSLWRDCHKQLKLQKCTNFIPHTMPHNYHQKLFDLLAGNRKIVLSPSQTGFWVFFSFSIWLAHLPYGTICSRQLNTTAALREMGRIAGLSFLGANSALCKDGEKAGSVWIVAPGSGESSHRCLRGGWELKPVSQLDDHLSGSFWRPCCLKLMCLHDDSFTLSVFIWELFRVKFTVAASQCFLLFIPGE